ncbi:hypothetical protein OBA40_03620 [Alphaproteobacteria bacterium]|nr:hypothetical protein [Alphaproteobacteria bacterium]
MKNKYNALANLYDLIQSAEKELGLKGITEKDRIVLKQMIENIDSYDNVKITYKQIRENLTTKDNNISRAQFFKSLTTLVNKKIISKIGMKRSSSFKFLSKN